ncbi:MAG: hydrolase 1, exosortase A system-associated [Novosphingobium sp.]
MTRRHLTFVCEGSTLVGTLDEAEGTTGLLLVSGGNELRSGAFAGQAHFAARIAAQGFPVFRYDRRGVGDSDGPNGEFKTGGPDIAAALAAFRAAAPQVTRIVALGNCDAASSLMLAGGLGCDALILSNPWTIEGEDDAAPSPEVLRDHYKRRLASPDAIKRLLTGQIPLGKLVRSLLGALRPAPAPTSLAQDMAAGISGFGGPVSFLIAERDRTAIAFLGVWDKADPRIRRCPGASHSYVEPEARDWLKEQVLDVLRAF